VYSCNIYAIVWQSPDQDDDQENEQAVQSECLEMFSGTDYIMEPGVFNQLKRYVSVNNHCILDKLITEQL